MKNFTENLASIPMVILSECAKEFSNMFNPPHKYDEETNEFFYAVDQAAFDAYAVGRFIGLTKSEASPNKVVKEVKSGGFFPVTKPLQIQEPNGLKSKECDSFAELAARVTELEKDMKGCHGAVVKLQQNTAAFIRIG